MMKWIGVLLVTFGIPLAALAEEAKSKALELHMVGYHDDLPFLLKGWDFPAMSMFKVEAQTPLDNVTVHITFFARDTPDFSVDEYKAIRCGVLWPEGTKAFRQALPILSGNGLEVWVPRIDPPNPVTLWIGWPEKGLQILAATMKVESEHYSEEKRWESIGVQLYRELGPDSVLSLREPKFRVVQLDQVCEQIVPYELPRRYLMAR
ncbi:hypothetical protein ACTRXD_00030 [Nitrospira sp. T9]|uniref:hypothetical protein n=1 Tax=unclassified Nitrospira TaxID=2652172 RepID=UPI003F9C438E